MALDNQKIVVILLLITIILSITSVIVTWNTTLGADDTRIVGQQSETTQRGNLGLIVEQPSTTGG